MWIFAFGSLMADGWEKNFNSISRCAAHLEGYSRSFAKRSVKNWGTKKNPGLTLILEPAAAQACHGFAFEFAGDNFEEKLRAYLRDREACDPTLVKLTLADNRHIEANAYVYPGKNLLPAETSLAEKRAIILKSGKGDKGTGIDYVRNAYHDLKGAGIADPVVTAMWDAVRNA